MKKINKIILLTIFICFTYSNLDEGSQIKFERVTIKSNIVDVKSASKILKSTLKPIMSVVETSYEKLHSATWYNSHGHKTASGQTFHKDSLTAAYNNVEFGTLLKVTNVENDKSISTLWERKASPKIIFESEYTEVLNSINYIKNIVKEL